MSVSRYEPRNEPVAVVLLRNPRADGASRVAAALRTPLPSLPPAALLDAAGRLRCDLPCVECGYNLRTLRHDGRCPECSADVRLAMRADRLYLCDPAALRRAAQGVFVAALSTCAPLIGPPLAITVATIWSIGARFALLLNWFWLLMLLNTLAGAAGVLLLTSPRVAALDGLALASGLHETSARGRRQAARVGAAVCIGVSVLIAALMEAVSDQPQLVPLGLVAVWPLAAAFTGVTALMYMEHLLDRLPGAPARAVTRAAWQACAVSCVAGVVLAVLLTLGLSLPRSIDPSIGPILLIAGVPTAIAGVLATAATVVLAVVACWRASGALRRTTSIAVALRASLTEAADGAPSKAQMTQEVTL